MQKKHVALITSSMVATSLITNATAAEQLPAEQLNSSLEEIVVYSQLRKESILEVPASVSYLSEDFIHAAGVSHLNELEFAVPSINFGAGTRKSRGEIAIRGIGDYSRNIGNDARVVVYVDGVPYVRSSTFNLAMIDVEQVEVLRGPQGTFFGTNAVAGSINITTKKPHDSAEQSIETEVGNFNKYRVNLAANIPISENVAARLDLGKEKADGFIDNIYLDRKLQGENYETARLKLRITPTKAIDVNVNFDWFDEDNDATNGLALVDDGTYNGFSEAPSNRKVSHDVDEYEARKLWGSSISTKLLTDQGFEWLFISSMRDNDFSTLNEEDYSSTPAVHTYFNEHSSQQSQELRLVSPKQENFDFLLGIFQMNQDIDTQRYALIGSNYVTTPGDLNTNTLSLYGHANYQFSENWKLSFGSRYVKEDKSIDYEIIDFTGSFTNERLLDSAEFSELLPKIGIQYMLDSAGTIYFNVSESFKSGGWNADFLADLSDIDFKPEYARNWELGYKNLFFNESVSLGLALFNINIDDLQVFQFVETGDTVTFQLTNAGEATSQGLELDLMAQLNPSFAFRFNSAYTDAVFDVFKNGGQDENDNGIDYDGNTLPYAPKWKHFIGLEYDNGKHYGHLHYSYSADYYSHPSNSEQTYVPSFYTLNGKLGMTINEHWEASLWANNITDSTHLRYREVSFLQIQRGFYEAPRTYGISLRFTN